MDEQQKAEIQKRLRAKPLYELEAIADGYDSESWGEEGMTAAKAIVRERLQREQQAAAPPVAAPPRPVFTRPRVHPFPGDDWKQLARELSEAIPFELKVDPRRYLSFAEEVGRFSRMAPGGLIGIAFFVACILLALGMQTVSLAVGLPVLTALFLTGCGIGAAVNIAAERRLLRLGDDLGLFGDDTSGPLLGQVQQHIADRAPARRRQKPRLGGPWLLLALMVLGILGGMLIWPHLPFAAHTTLRFTIPAHAELVYPLNTPLPSPDAAGVKQRALLRELAPMARALRDGLRVSVLENEVRISLLDNTASLGRHRTALRGALDRVFGAGAYRDPNPGMLEEALDPVTVEDTCNVLSKRLNNNGIRGARITRVGERGIEVRVSTLVDASRVRALLTDPARLELRLLPKGVQGSRGTAGVMTFVDAHGAMLTAKDALASSYLVMDGSELDGRCSMTKDNARKPAISFRIGDARERRRFATLTGKCIGQAIAIVYNDRIVATPIIQSQIDGEGIITGFKENEAKDITALLNAGALPAPVVESKE